MSSQRPVLHVDDDPTVLEVSSDWAAVRDEIDWLTASDTQPGLETLSTHDVDCLVSDSSRAADPASQVTTRDGGDDAETEQWVLIGRYRPAEGDDLATVIVTAVEAYTGRNATGSPPLYDAVDTDALSLLVRRANGRACEAVRIRFAYADRELAVTGDGVVLVRD